MAISAFIVKVPSAESMVGALRERFDATSKLGVPAHITLLVPFMDPESISVRVLEQAKHALEKTAAFSFALSWVGRFPATAYLAPEPAAPFIAMTQALTQTFPGFRPYGGEHQGVIPHLTVAHGSDSDADEAAAILRLQLAQSAVLVGQCRSVALIENSSGRWREMHVFHLPQTGFAANPGPAC